MTSRNDQDPPYLPETLDMAHAAEALGITREALKKRAARDRVDGTPNLAAPVPVITGGGGKPRYGYTWDSLNAWLSRRGRTRITPYCPCCGRV